MTSIYPLLRQMEGEHIVVAYNGAIDEKLLEAVYSMMDKHMEEHKTPADKRKKLFHILVESLQNVFHHHEEIDIEMRTGFVIKCEGDVYTIVTGNHVMNSDVDELKKKLEKVNSLSPAELRTHYQQTLASTELSQKGGAGLGIIEMARKSGNKLKYEITRVNDEYSFFTLQVTI